MDALTPRQIVEQLDRYIIGQDKAKRAVAIALRNRYRRAQCDPDMQEEITPKNIIMVGPTGVGKTEIARRLARLVHAPFVKVEATKFTEVGYVGRDVESMIRDLVEAAIRLEKQARMDMVLPKARILAQTRLIELLAPGPRPVSRNVNPLDALFGNKPKQPEPTEEQSAALIKHREQIQRDLADGKLEDTTVEVEVEENMSFGMEVIPGMGADINLNDIMGGILPKKTKKRKVPVREARKILEQEEADKLIDMDDVIAQAVRNAEQHGIIFIDEIDKVAGRSMMGSGPDVSREGVQRDILPIVEGSTVMTKYGPVKTDYILFIAAGAFHVAKVSDLIPELQGRFPIHVELASLTAEDFKRILTQPENAVVKQYEALLRADNITLKFTDEALASIAQYAFTANEQSENIGARRLHTIIENLLEDISFNASGDHPMLEVIVDERYVHEHLPDNFKGKNVRKFIL
ncbi:MAG: ATP-dependent protease ATPase subunit HslU [Bacillota bacterium]